MCAAAGCRSDFRPPKPCRCVHVHPLRSCHSCVQELKEANVDRETAREILKLWQSSGVTDDPDELRELYRARSRNVIGRFAIQLIFDAGACYGVR